ncbi:NTP transferase domain-containing protein [Actinomadura atramentaria]|uniref:NTP transferase domain-containing protein n=1 Tax=Actinomadura atramentaria TaxID=1990 RepID=UPI0003792BAC
MPDAGFDAVVLAGGGARRLGGRDKPAAPVGGRSLLARVADAVADARTLVVVGPPRPDVPNARAVREDPPGAGPVPALRTGLAALTSPAPTLALLAADLPFLDATHVDALRAAARAGSGAVLVDENGREQWLAGHWSTEALSEALGTYEGASLHGLLSPLNPVKLKLEPGPRAPWFDCDTPEELAEANALLNQNR